MTGASVVERRQIELAQAGGVREQVDLDDPAVRDREAGHRDRLAARSHDKSGGAVHERRPGEAGGYGLSGALWQLMLAALAFNALETAGTIVWATMKQQHVPRAMLGRVSSLDWLISIGLLPLSFALTGPVAGAIGTRGTLVAAGVVGAVVTSAAFFAPGMRDIERAARAPAPRATSFADRDTAAEPQRT